MVPVSQCADQRTSATRPPTICRSVDCCRCRQPCTDIEILSLRLIRPSVWPAPTTHNTNIPSPLPSRLICSLHSPVSVTVSFRVHHHHHHLSPIFPPCPYAPLIRHIHPSPSRTLSQAANEDSVPARRSLSTCPRSTIPHHYVTLLAYYLPSPLLVALYVHCN